MRGIRYSRVGEKSMCQFVSNHPQPIQTSVLQFQFKSELYRLSLICEYNTPRSPSNTTNKKKKIRDVLSRFNVAKQWIRHWNSDTSPMTWPPNRITDDEWQIYIMFSFQNSSGLFNSINVRYSSIYIINCNPMLMPPLLNLLFYSDRKHRWKICNSIINFICSIRRIAVQIRFQCDAEYTLSGWQ